MTIPFKEAFGKTGADKHLHAYDEVYEENIDKTKIESILEIGVLNGASLKSWKLIWPEIVIEGMDIKDPGDNADGFKVYIQDSTDTELASDIGEYDIILDDGDHYWDRQFATFKNYYHKAKKYYIIEDIVGGYGLDNLKALLKEYDNNILDNSVEFKSGGPIRSFRHLDGHTEISSYYGLLFKK